MAECLGSINSATLESIEVKKTTKGGKMAVLVLGFPGNVEVRAVAFSGKGANNPVEDLGAFVEGETIPNIFGKVSSDEHNEKVYTNLQVLKIGTDKKDKTGFRVTGRVKNVGQTQYAKFVDIDTTDGDYESWVRLELPRDAKSNPFRVGQKVRDLSIAPKGKYGTWTLVNVPKADGGEDDGADTGDTGDQGEDAPEAPAQKQGDTKKAPLDL